MADMEQKKRSCKSEAFITAIIQTRFACTGHNQVRMSKRDKALTCPPIDIPVTPRGPNPLFSHQ
jgi:hypothetical protein